MLDTRRGADGRIGRRRACERCGYRYHTIEQLSAEGLHVRKTDGDVVPFDPERIRKSVRKAVVHEHPKKWYDDLVDAVVDDIRRDTSGPIPSREVGRAVLRQLFERDKPSHIRYALVQAGRQDRDDERSGWDGIREVRKWLQEEYPDLQTVRPLPGLSEVIKHDGRREAFDRRKLERSIGLSSKGRGSTKDVHDRAVEVANAVENALRDQPIVTSGQISAEILRNLRKWDPIAYLRFASTTKGYRDAADYDTEANALRDPNHTGS